MLFYVEIGVKGAGGGDGLDVRGGDESGSDVCLAEALFWSFSDLRLLFCDHLEGRDLQNVCFTHVYYPKKVIPQAF